MKERNQTEPSIPVPLRGVFNWHWNIAKKMRGYSRTIYIILWIYMYPENWTQSPEGARAQKLERFEFYRTKHVKSHLPLLKMVDVRGRTESTIISKSLKKVVDILSGSSVSLSYIDIIFLWNASVIIVSQLVHISCAPTLPFNNHPPHSWISTCLFLFKLNTKTDN